MVIFAPSTEYAPDKERIAAFQEKELLHILHTYFDAAHQNQIVYLA